MGACDHAPWPGGRAQAGDRCPLPGLSAITEDRGEGGAEAQVGVLQVHLTQAEVLSENVRPAWGVAESSEVER